jgi:hypothetical protein
VVDVPVVARIFKRMHIVCEEETSSLRHLKMTAFIQPSVALCIMYFGPTNSLVCNKTLIQMSYIKTLKITPTCLDHQLIIIRRLLILVKITG